MVAAIDSLSAKQKAFVREYVVDFNGAAAAVRAGYSPKGSSAGAARLLANVSVQRAVAEASKKVADDAGLRASDVIEGLRRVAFAELRKAVQWGPDGVTLLDSGEIDEETAFAVAEVSETTTRHGGSQRIKMHSKPQALEALARYFGLFKDNINVRGAVAFTMPATPEDAAELLRLAEQLDRPAK